jgi:predicted MFS family arabinose efflux permease
VRHPRGTLAVLTASAFLIFAQAFMVAPILPRLAQLFRADVGVVGLSVPAYLVPYGVVTLLWGPLADRFGRRPVILVALASFTAMTAATLTSPSVSWFIAWRVGAGAVASGVVPVGLALIGDLFAYSERGRAVGWLFGGMAGGMAVGSTAGALAEPSVGWRGLFAVVAVGGLLLLAAAAVTIPDLPGAARSTSPRTVLHAYVSLLRGSRARRTYGYVGFNAVLHSGVYTWLGLYLHQRFGLGPVGVGLGLLGYGIPGFVLGPLIGRLADRHGRAGLVPAGVGVGALAVLGLAAPVPLVAAALLVTLLSLGYDLTQPLLAGIVTDLPGHRGQAVAFMAVTLFVGFGVGSLVFQAALTFGFTIALTLFGVVAALAAVLALPTFADERAHRHVPG